MEEWTAVILALTTLLLIMVAVLIRLVVTLKNDIKRSRNFNRGPFHSTTLDIDKICEDLSPTNGAANPTKDQRPDEVNHVVVTIRGDNDCNGHNQAGTSARSESDDSANFNSNKRSMDKKNVQWNFSPIDAKRYGRAFPSTDFKDYNGHNQIMTRDISESDGSRFISDGDDTR